MKFIDLILDPVFNLQPMPTLDFFKFSILTEELTKRKIVGLQVASNEECVSQQHIAIIGFLGCEFNLINDLE